MQKTETGGTRAQTSKSDIPVRSQFSRRRIPRRRKETKKPYRAGASQEVDAIVEVLLGSAIVGSAGALKDQAQRQRGRLVTWEPKRWKQFEKQLKKRESERRKNPKDKRRPTAKMDCSSKFSRVAFSAFDTNFVSAF